MPVHGMPHRRKPKRKRGSGLLGNVQKGVITGSLGTALAAKVISKIRGKIRGRKKKGGRRVLGGRTPPFRGFGGRHRFKVTGLRSTGKGVRMLQSTGSGVHQRGGTLRVAGAGPRAAGGSLRRAGEGPVQLTAAQKKILQAIL